MFRQKIPRDTQKNRTVVRKEIRTELSFRSCQPGDVCLKHCKDVKSERQEFSEEEETVCLRQDSLRSSKRNGLWILKQRGWFVRKTLECHRIQKESGHSGPRQGGEQPLPPGPRVLLSPCIGSDVFARNREL